MKGNYCLNPRNHRSYFLNPRNDFLNPRNYCLNPRNYFLIWAPNPETIYKTRFAFTNPNHWTRIAVNHLKCRDYPEQVNHVLTKGERLPGCWCKRCSFSFVPCSWTPHLRIRRCYSLAFQSVNSFSYYIIIYVYICQLELYLSLLVYCSV